MGFFDFLLDAVDGAITGKGNSLGATLGKAFRIGYCSTANNSENPEWVSYCDAWAENGANCVYFEVKHKRGHEDCTLITTFFDTNENVIDQKFWTIPFDQEIKQLHKKVISFNE